VAVQIFAFGRRKNREMRGRKMLLSFGFIEQREQTAGVNGKVNV
jgi:hypothetical protein